MLPGGIRALLTLSLVTLVTLTTLPTHGSAPAERPRPGAAAEIALDHLRAHHERYGVGAADVADLRVQDALVSPHTGVTHVYIRQRHQGLDVLGGDATVNVGPDGPVIHVGSRLVAGLASASGTARLDAPAAVRAAASALGLRPDASLRVARGPAPGGERATVLTRGGISLSPIPVRLAYQPSPQGIRLAWNLEIEEISEEHWWNVSVDASTGAVLAEIDYVAHDRGDEIAAATGRVTGRRLAPLAAGSGRGNDGARYRVFALPLESPNDGDRTLVTSPADALASPFGWHDTNGAAGPEFTTTQGNNVHAYLDTTNTATTGVVPPGLDAEGGPTLTFDFPWNPDLPPTATKDAAVTNLFYWNNVIHDVFYRYGFTEAAGNFQVNNYGRGGTGNDSVRAEAQDGSGTNNANFATPADGSRPRMQMYVWTTGLQSQRRIIDGDMDAGVIIHEYGHGISNRLTGGRNNVGCLNNQEQMGEGWSDWLAIALTALPTETGAQRRGMGTYVLAQPNRQGSGIRPTPYSTNMSINGATYDTIKTAAVPHGVGYVWSTMLWEVFWDLVDEHGFNPNVYEDWTTGGNNLAIQLVMDGMKMQPCSPGFVDGRNAI
ncbi:MAG TPA: M36 family metallopeptidase, partial [Actinomycetota bacterium]|nr:M36 family metallopeptidase [Actinomycetota bacterium]